MAIISKESFEKLTKEEKENIREGYIKWQEEAETNPYFEGKISNMEDLFDKEDLQPKPVVKTWEDVPLRGEALDVDFMINDLGGRNIISLKQTEFSEKIFMKLIVTAKIAKIIELGYGGMITEEEWKNNILEKYCVAWSVPIQRFHYQTMYNLYNFIAFHTQEQREKFMFYPENRELVKQYYMV